MDSINSLQNALFPASAESWKFMQDMILMVQQMANVSDGNYILSGCVDNGSSVTSGFVVINGEILPFEGGTKTTNVIIQETNQDVVSQGVTYPGVYTTRKVVFGSGTGEIAWSSFMYRPKLKKVYEIDIGVWDTPTQQTKQINLPAEFNSDVAARVKRVTALLRNDRNWAVNNSRWYIQPIESEAIHGASVIIRGDFEVPERYHILLNAGNDGLFRSDLIGYANRNANTPSNYSRGTVIIEID